jgi:dimethylargininase
MPTALIREIPSSFDRALTQNPSTSIDVDLARGQHTVYTRRLEAAGYQLSRILADESLPDCVFVEDAAVIVGDIAVITRPGPAARRGETRAVAEELSGRFELTTIDDPGTIDGGDVFVMDRTVYAGHSKRSNHEGLRQLETVAKAQDLDFVVVEVRDGLHLKSAVLPIESGTVVVTRGAVDETAIGSLRMIYEEENERFRFSALPLGEKLLVTTAAPRTCAVVAATGLDLDPIDVSEILAADGGLTCMSILY